MKAFRVALGRIFSISLFTTATAIWAAPQDNWWLERQWVTNSGTTNLVSYSSPMAFSPSGEIIAILSPGQAGATNQIRVFDTNGVLLRGWSVPYAYDVDVDTNGQVYVLTTNTVKVFQSSSSSNLIRQWSAVGATSYSGYYPGIAVSKDGLVAVSLLISNQIAIYDTSGNFIRKWGTAGTLTGQLNKPCDVAIGASGYLYVSDMPGRVQRFDLFGNFDSTATAAYNASYRAVISPDEALLSKAGAFSPDGQYLYARSPLINISPMVGINGGSPSLTSSVGLTNGTSVGVYHRIYRTLTPLTNNALPLPVVINSAQRVGTTLVDVDYLVIDPDNTNVQIAAAAFLNGGTNLNSIIPMRTFEEGTTNAIGLGLSVGDTHHLTWNAAADLATNFVSLQVEILAKDNRGICGFDFLTIPNSADGPALTISRSGLTSTDFLNVWIWLVATGDTSVALTNGNLVAVGGAYDGQTLASGSTTTAEGQSFLFALLNVRAATAEEITRASSGNYGFIGGGTAVVKLP